MLCLCPLVPPSSLYVQRLSGPLAPPLAPNLIHDPDVILSPFQFSE